MDFNRYASLVFLVLSLISLGLFGLWVYFCLYLGMIWEFFPQDYDSLLYVIHVFVAAALNILASFILGGVLLIMSLVFLIKSKLLKHWSRNGKHAP